MKVGNISNNNFGKTVRINMPTNATYALVNILNSKNVHPDDVEIQREAKAIFNDTFEGSAVYCSPDEGKTSYILTGQEASTLFGIRKKALDALNAIGVFYEEGPFLEKNIQYIFKKENRDVSKLINSTKENYVLTVHSDEKTGLPRLAKLSVIG
ncbi:MAG: hypothetical protein IJY61_08685 [Candidatus Gastranaerophilales bacterium]|nr:hypothetical protein [Candidatus Gastranaerophilales bacterium]